MLLIRSVTLLGTLLVAAAPLAMHAQDTGGSPGKKVLGVEDYTRWRTIQGAQLSHDGKWAVYGLRHVNTLAAEANPVLRLRDVVAGTEIEIADASQPSFSPDGKWLTYLVEIHPKRPAPKADSAATPTPADSAPAPAPTPTARGAAGTTIKRRWELRELATGVTRSWQEIQSASFSTSSSHLVLRRRAPTSGNAGGGTSGGSGASGPNAPRGLDAILHDLTADRSLYLGSVNELAFNQQGSHLAYTVDAAVRDANGVYLVTLATSRIEALDNDTLRYGRLAWNDAGSAVAVLKGREVEKKRERTNRLMVFTDVATPTATMVLDPTTTAGFPAGFEISERASLEWSEDGHRVFLGIIPQTTAPDTGRRKSTDSLANVDVWLTQDERIQSQQMVQAEMERNRTFRQAFEVATGRYIRLTDSAMRELELPVSGIWAVGRDPRPYISDWKQPAADFFRVNTVTGERTPMLTGQLTGQHVGGISPDGTRFLYWKDARWHAYDLAAGTTRAIGTGAPSLINREYDYPGTKPSYGVAGYAADGSGVIAQSRYDLWLLPFDAATPARNLTNGIGTRDEIVFRPVRITPIDSTVRRAARVAREIDLTAPITLSAYGEWTKKSGFSRLANGQLQTLVFDDASFSTPNGVDGSDLVLFTRQTFREFPDVLLAKQDLANPVKISDANPHQAEYRWGRRILFDYTTRRGVKLQGILALPDDYVAGQKLPMLVTFYEKNSQTMHRYPTPSFLSGMGGMPVEAVSRGYATMLPDVHFHTGSSHSDMLDAVEAATRKVIAMGYVDAKRIGVHGHSYGGEGAAFIGTRSNLFAAVGMGAGVTDLTTDFSQSWGWSYQVSGGSGLNGNHYYIHGQGRWGFSPWDNPERYRFESAMTHAPQAKAPILIMHGTADPTVGFSEGMNFYNALRFNGKSAVMLAYPGEGHGLSGLANRKDLTIRYFEFFDHYLRGTAAPAWMTTGVPFIAKDAK
jgi:dipeptidyl aminopeptidase/acylaminoacyl peptidase